MRGVRGNLDSPHYYLDKELIMDLENLTYKELVAVAEMFPPAEKKANKPAQLKELRDTGVTYAMYAATLEPAEEDVVELTDFDDTPLPVNDEVVVGTALVEVPVVVAPAPVEPEYTLIKMERRNETYQINGYTFKQSHPFALVKEEDADYLVEHIKGFRPATGKEIRQFYGND
jgi:hypothetical protein